MQIKLKVFNTDLESGLVPDSSIIECSGSSEKQHDGNQRVQDHGQHQGDQVEQGDVSKEHGDVHLRGAGVFKITLWNL